MGLQEMVEGVYIYIYTLSRLSRVQLFTDPWTVTHQAPLSRGFSKQEYWSGLPFPPPRICGYARVHVCVCVCVCVFKQIAHICWMIEKAREFQKKQLPLLQGQH